MKKNRNVIVIIDPRYERQQSIIKEVCRELNLVVFYPSYHADKTDKNSVIIYTREGEEYNKTLPAYASVDDEKGRVCEFENSDANGLFDLDWMNHGTIDLRRSYETKEKIEKFIKERLERYNSKQNKA